MDYLTASGIGLMFGLGVFQLLRRNIIRAAMGLVILANAVNLFLLTCGATDGTVAPFTTAVGIRSDALPQALVLTAIVISMGSFALMLALLRILSGRYRTSDADEIRGLTR